MKKNLVYILFCLSLFALIAVLFSNNKKYEKQFIIQDKEKKQLTSYLWTFKESINHSYQCYQKRLPNISLKDSEENTYCLRDVIGGNDKLIFVTTELNCEPCINLGIENLKKFINKVGGDRVIVLSSYKNFRDFYSFDRMTKLSCKVFNIEEGALNLPVDKLNMPYMFKALSSMHLQYVFVPIKGFDYPTLDYYNFMIQEFIKE